MNQIGEIEYVVALKNRNLPQCATEAVKTVSRLAIKAFAGFVLEDPNNRMELASFAKGYALIRKKGQRGHSPFSDLEN